MMGLFWSLLGILSGAFIAVQAPINSQLARGLGLPVYAVAQVSGKDHNQQFAVTCTVAEPNRVASGRGTSRRRAEQAAAETMLIELKGGDG